MRLQCESCNRANQRFYKSVYLAAWRSKELAEESVKESDERINGEVRKDDAEKYLPRQGERMKAYEDKTANIPSHQPMSVSTHMIRYTVQHACI